MPFQEKNLHFGASETGEGGNRLSVALHKFFVNQYSKGFWAKGGARLLVHMLPENVYKKGRKSSIFIAGKRLKIGTFAA